jgi:transcriptional regulator with XRE-family HTH domain
MYVIKILQNKFFVQKKLQMKNLAELIENKIQEKGWSIQLIASEIGMSRTNVYAAMKINDLKLSSFDKLSDLLNIEPNYFFEWNKKEEKVIEKDYSYPNENELIAYYRGQIDKLTSTVNNLTELLNKK